MTDLSQEFEPPASADEIQAAISRLASHVHEIEQDLEFQTVKVRESHELLEKLVGSHNAVGQNVAWLVANTQGLFQMFSDPEVINKMMSGMMGGLANGGQPAATSE